MTTMASGSCYGISEPVRHSFPSRPPLPRRLLSLQDTIPSTPRSASPYGSTYRELVTPTGASTGLSTPPSSGRPGMSRPGAPKRSHSFCGDTSKSTFALASANACGHLSSDKKELVAPPLERTLSSIGCKGNRSPPSQQMARPLAHAPGVMTPPTPPASPDFFGERLPQITIHPGSPARPSTTSKPTRPALSPYQPNMLGISRDSQPARPVRPSLAPLRNLSASSVFTDSSRSSSYTIGTPGTPRLLPLTINEEDFRKGISARHYPEDAEYDLMEVDEMVERVEDMAVMA